MRSHRRHGLVAVEVLEHRVDALVLRVAQLAASPQRLHVFLADIFTPYLALLQLSTDVIITL